MSKDRPDDRQLSAWESSAEQVLEGVTGYALSSLSKHDYARRVLALVGEVRRLQAERDEARASAQRAWARVEAVHEALEGGRA